MAGPGERTSQPPAHDNSTGGRTGSFKTVSVICGLLKPRTATTKTTADLDMPGIAAQP
ncbi:hypothetical protein ACWDOR_12265 [Streptosporangium canum]